MSYKRNANANRDALFGGAGGGGGTKKSSNAANRDALFGGASGRSKPTNSRPKSAAAAPPPVTRTVVNKKGKPRKPALKGEAREAKLKQAEEYRDKANKCMQNSFFSKPDPVAASTYYKRAAEAYQQAGDEDRLERLYRQESGKCNMQIGAWASAASDYCRAAELLIPKDAEPGDELPDAPEYPTLEKRRFAASVFYKEAGKAFTESKFVRKTHVLSLSLSLAHTYAHEGNQLCLPCLIPSL